MEKENKLEPFKPSGWLYIFLFLYYCVLIIQGYAVIYDYLSTGMGFSQQFGTIDWIITALNILVFIYCFYAVIKTLRGDLDCLTALKWALVISFLCALPNSTRRLFAYADSVPSSWIWLIFVVPVFLIIFFLYLCLSKGIKRRYPEKLRRFSPSGWIWTGLTGVFVAIVCFVEYQEYQMDSYCRRADITRLVLGPQEVSDGYVVFCSDRKWETSNDFETALVNDGSLLLYPGLFSLRNSNDEIYSFSGRSDTPPARTHNKSIYQLINYLFGENKYETYKEFFHMDFIGIDKRIITTSFEVIKEEGTLCFISISSVFDSQSPKLITFLQMNNEFDKNELNELAKSVKFDLEKFKKSKDDKSGEDGQDTKPQRIGKRNDKSVSNMFAAFFNGSPPRHLVGKMLLEHNEGKVANY